MSSRWIQVNQELRLYHGEETLQVSAGKIYGSIFENRPVNIAGHQMPDIRDDLTDLKFSRHQSFPCLVVHLSGQNEMIVSIHAEIGRSHFPLAGNADQIIVDGTWHAVNVNSVEEMKSLLAEHSIPLDSPITISQLIQLKLIEGIRLYEDATAGFSDPGEKPVPVRQSVGGLTGKLYPYQQNGVGFLHAIANQNLGCILGDEMGVGKTLQAIALLQLEKNAGRPKSLVIVPATVLENWYRELARFAPGLSVFIHQGPERPGMPSGFDLFDVVIVSYDTAMRDEIVFTAIEWNLVILDEAQDIKNPDALKTKFVKRLPRRVSIAISGTPMENRLEDLWSISDFVLPELLGDIESFRSEFSDAPTDTERLSRAVAPILLRRFLKDVAKDLPKKIEIPQPLKMSIPLAKAYELIRKETREEYGSAAPLVLLNKLRILCTHPTLSTIWNDDPSYEMAKYQRTLELLAEFFASNEKVLIFTSFVEMSELFLQDLRRRWPEAYLNLIIGDVAVKKRQPIIDEFSGYTGYGALILNPKAGGRGLNIPAANHVIHYNPEWNPAITDQATGRSYRRGQTKPVTVHHLYFINSVEEVIFDRVHFKRDLAQRVLKGTDGIPQVNGILEAALSMPTLSELSSVK